MRNVVLQNALIAGVMLMATVSSNVHSEEAAVAMDPVPPVKQEAPAQITYPPLGNASSGADKSKMRKMCLGPYCINDPIGKHGGLNNFTIRKNQIHHFKPSPLDCKGFPLVLNPLNNPNYEVEVVASPAHQKQGISNYYRINMVKVTYPKINQSEMDKLYEKITTRTGEWFDRGIWTNPANVKQSVTLRVESTSTSLYFDLLNISEEHLREAANQPGCTSKAPDL